MNEAWTKWQVFCRPQILVHFSSEMFVFPSHLPEYVPSINRLQWGSAAMLIISGGLWNHWFGLNVGHTWACKTVEIYWSSKNKAS